MNRRNRRFQVLETRRMLFSGVGPIDWGWAPLEQVAAHVRVDATLGPTRGDLVPTTDYMLDQLFDVASQHGDFSTGGPARSTRVADINGDGRPDLVSLSYESLLTQLQQPDGSLGARTYTDLADLSPYGTCAANDFALADTNGDSAAEVVLGCFGVVIVAEFDEQQGFDRILYQSDDLRFSADMAASSDLNGDGIADFVFASHQRHDEMRVFWGTGTGELTPRQTSQSNDSYVKLFFLGDIDDDQYDDLVFVLDDTDRVWVQRGNGDGTFRDLEDLVGINSNRSFLAFDAADLNGDGTTDLITSDYFENINIWYKESFGYRLQTIAMPDYVLDLDVSHDGAGGGPVVYVMMQQTSGFPRKRIDSIQIVNESSFQLLDRIDVLDGTGQRIVDINHDSIDDVLIDHSTVATVLEVDDTFRFSAVRDVTLTDSPSPISKVVADFNRDGYNDIVYFHRRVDHFTMIRGGRDAADSSQFDVIRYDLPGSLSIGQAFATDYNNDGFTDIIGVPEDHSASIVRMTGRGDGSFAPPQMMELEATLTLDGLVIEDITGDGNVDLLVIVEFAGGGRWQVWRGDGTGEFIKDADQSSMTPRTLFVSPSFVDGRVLSMHGDGTVRSSRLDTSGAITTAEIMLTIDSPDRVRHFLPANLNGDGVPDFVVSRNLFNSSFEVYVSNGLGGYDVAQLAFKGYVNRLSADDSSGDGIDEIFVEGDRSSLLAYQRDGEIVVNELLQSGRAVTAAMASRVDLNGDGRDDFVYLNSGLTANWGRSGVDGSSLKHSPWLFRDHVNYFDVEVRGYDGVPLFVSAWIDFDQDGRWSDAEQVVSGAPVNVDDRKLFEFDVPGEAVAGKTWARIRLSDSPEIGADGIALDGEVEDYEVQILDFALMDFGDAPTESQSDLLSSYPTRLSQNGARHIVGGPRISLVNSAEDDGTPAWSAVFEEHTSSNVLLPSFVAGEPSVLNLPIRGESGFVNAWLDANRDGDWDDPGEQIIRGQWLDLRPWETVANHSIPVEIPETLAGQITYMRLRVSSVRELGPTGLAPDGEIIDTAVFVSEPTTSKLLSLVIGNSGPGLSINSPDSPLRFAVHLSSKPDSTWTVTVDNPDPDTVSVSPQTLSFGIDDWDEPQFLSVQQVTNSNPAAVVQLLLTAANSLGQNTDAATVEILTVHNVENHSSDGYVELATGETLIAGPQWSAGSLVWVDNMFNRQVVRGEDRVIVGGTSLWQNPISPYDVNRSGSVSPLDALNVINEIDRRGENGLVLGTPSEFQQTNPTFIDVSGDSSLSPLDALMVINYLGRQVSDGEGESVDFGRVWDWPAGDEKLGPIVPESTDRDELEDFVDLVVSQLF